MNKVLKTKLNERLRAAHLFELFEEGVCLYEENVKFNDEEHQKYDDKIAELTDAQDKLITGEHKPDPESLDFWK